MTVRIIQRKKNNRFNTKLSDVVNPLLLKIYESRDVESERELDYSLTALAPFHELKNIDDAAVLLANAVIRQQRIVVVGDFDCDGATSSALAVSALAAMGAGQVEFLTPNRFEYGYGLTPEIVAVALEKKPDLLITVDNGIANHDGVLAARKAEVDVLVTDHHLPASSLPDANVIVNPNQPGCPFRWKNTAGVGVIFYVLCALRAELKRQNPSAALPNMAQFLDLVALGTVADVVTLDHNNRIFVHQGIERIRAGHTRCGIKALIEVTKRQQLLLSTSDLGFSLGPRLNAAGRLDDMSIGIKLLLTEEMQTARALANQLNELNHSRRQIELTMQKDSEEELAHLTSDSDFDQNRQSLPWGICLFRQGWHQGVIGILASRIKEKTGRPVIAFAVDKEVSEGKVILKGSARSVAGLNIRDVLSNIASSHPGLLLKFGGHAMAAGLTLMLEDYARFGDYFDQQVRNILTEDDLQLCFKTDGELEEEYLSLEIANLLKNAGPWGHNFPEPVFSGVFRVYEQKLLAGAHLKMLLSPPESEKQIDAIKFSVDTDLWPDSSTEYVRCVYSLDSNYFRGRFKLQMLLRYIEPVLELEEKQLYSVS